MCLEDLSKVVNNQKYKWFVSQASPITGRKGDAMLAAHLASEAALRLVKPGNETYEVTDTVSKIAESFKCKVVILEKLTSPFLY